MAPSAWRNPGSRKECDIAEGAHDFESDGDVVLGLHRRAQQGNALRLADPPQAFNRLTAEGDIRALQLLCQTGNMRVLSGQRTRERECVNRKREKRHRHVGFFGIEARILKQWKRRTR